MHKQLPQPKKSLKTFILEDDAKITDKTAAKITITTAFLAINIAAASQDANAKGHSNHSDHANNLNVDSDYGTGYHIGNNPSEVDINSIQDKSVLSAHGNHYNHSDASGGSGGGLLGIVFSIAVAYFAPYALGAMGAGSVSVVGGGIVGSGAAGAMAAGTAALGGGSYALGAVISGVGSSLVSNAIGFDPLGLNPEAPGIESINTGAPHVVPGPIINALREEEQS